MGACTGIVGLFKHLLHVRAHPQFFGLELRVPMGACTGQYGMSVRNGFMIEIYGFTHTFLACVTHGAIAMEDSEVRRQRQARKTSPEI